MKKIMNKVEDFVEELALGLTAAYPKQIRLLEDDWRVVLRAEATPKGKVAIVTAGGSGHLPVFVGYVGRGVLDGCALGNVFASPSANKMHAMIKAVDSGAGVLCLYGNYGGDRMNFDMACEMAELDDIETTSVVIADDVASAPKAEREKRRGIAGMTLIWKAAGAAAEKGMTLAEVTRVAKKACDHTVSMGVALSPCIVPEVGKPNFSIGEGEMEIGMGIHGEPGIEVTPMKTADEIATLLTQRLVDDLSLSHGDEVVVMVNGLGGTPGEELHICYYKVHRLLNEMGIAHTLTPYIGEYATSMEMAGLSLTFMKLDDELRELMLAPAVTPFFTNLHKI